MSGIFQVYTKKRKQQKLLTNPVAFVSKTEVLLFSIFRPESSIKMIFEFGFNRYDFEPKFAICNLIPYSQICKILILLLSCCNHHRSAGQYKQQHYIQSYLVNILLPADVFQIFFRSFIHAFYTFTCR